MTTYSFPKKTKANNTTDKEYQYPGFIQLSLDTPEGEINLFGASFPIDKLMNNKRKNSDSIQNKYVNTLLAVIAREYETATEQGVVCLNNIESKILENLRINIVPTLESTNTDVEILEDLM